MQDLELNLLVLDLGSQQVGLLACSVQAALGILQVMLQVSQHDPAG